MKNQVITIWPHPFDKKKAYVLGRNGRHWITTDQGKTFDAFEIDALPSLRHFPLSFHGWDSGKVIFHGDTCLGLYCIERAYYTTDDFKTIKSLRDDIVGCS